MGSKVHPNLRLEFGISMVLGLVFLLSGISLLVWGLILVGILTGLVHWFAVDGFQTSIISWLVPALCFLSGGVLFYFGRHLAMVYPGWLRRVTWLLDHTQPRKMVLTFPQHSGTPGRTAELREEGKPDMPEPSETVEVRSPQWKIKDPGENLVDVFREFESDGIVVMAAGYGIIWGFRKPRDFAGSMTQSGV
jgi:hypothetical protein